MSKLIYEQNDKLNFISYMFVHLKYKWFFNE